MGSFLYPKDKAPKKLCAAPFYFILTDSPSFVKKNEEAKTKNLCM
jgi:hypothetical protein